MYHFSIALDEKNTCTYGITNWELSDGYFGAPLSRMTPDQVEDARDLLIRKLSRIVLYTVSEPVSDYASYVRFFRNAHLIGVENVKLSYAAICGATNEEIQKIVAIGTSFSIGVLFELEAEHMDVFGFERYAAIRNTNTGLVYNPNEFTKAGILPYTNILSKTKYAGDIRFLRACDMQREPAEYTNLQKGNSEIKECTSKLLARSYSGYFAFNAYSDKIPVGNVIADFSEILCAM